MVMTLTEGHRVGAKQNLLGSFSCILLNRSGQYVMQMREPYSCDFIEKTFGHVQTNLFQTWDDERSC